MRKERYAERPPRYEYRLTDKGRAFWDVLAALWRFGEDWMWEPGTEPPVQLVDRETERASCGPWSSTSTPASPRSAPRANRRPQAQRGYDGGFVRVSALDVARERRPPNSQAASTPSK